MIWALLNHKKLIKASDQDFRVEQKWGSFALFSLCVCVKNSMVFFFVIVILLNISSSINVPAYLV